MLDLRRSLLRKCVITVREKGSIAEFAKKYKVLRYLWNPNSDFILHPTLNVIELVFKQRQVFQLPEWILIKKHKYWENNKKTNRIIVVADGLAAVWVIAGVPVFCRFVLPSQIFLPPIKSVGSTIRQRKMLPVKLWFINVYTYHNSKPTLKVMQIQ